MKPASRIEATIEILKRDQDIGLPLDSVVGDYMRQRRYIGSKDRHDISNRIYEMARVHAKLCWWLDRLKTKDSPRIRVLAWLAIGEQADLKRLNELFDGSKYAPEKLNEKEQELAKKLVGKPLFHKDMPDIVQLECPAEYEQTLKDIFGENFDEEMTAMLEPATLDLRVNIFLQDREAVKALLEKDNVETTETPYSPWGLRCAKKTYLTKTKAMNKGFIEIQDEGSQLIAYLANVQPGMQVLDYCAGAGGKTLALASAMQRKGRIVAMDTEERRLEKGRRRYKKAQLADIIEVRPLSDQKNRKWLRRQKGTFDLVLTDVPCSGTGTWRRNPDMRWRTYGPSVEELTVIQAEIMEKVAHTVKVGGKFVYATCSLLPQENELQIENFLKNHPEFEVLLLEEELGLGSPFMRLTPYRHNTDGFFAAVLVRKS